MLVITRNATTTVCTNWRAWLVLALIATAVFGVLVLIGVVLVGMALTISVALVLAIPAVQLAGLISAAFRG